MDGKRLEAYEVLEQKRLEGIQSDGTLLRHKRAEQGSYLSKMMMKTKYLQWDSGHRRRTAQDFRIFWNTPCCADREIFRLRIRSLSW